jgi:hypothetical protein
MLDAGWLPIPRLVVLVYVEFRLRVCEGYGTRFAYNVGRPHCPIRNERDARCVLASDNRTVPGIHH